MPKVKLTKTVVDRAEHTGRGNATIFRDTDLPGLGLRVTVGGAKSYVVEYRAGGRKRRITIGRHGALTVDKARNVAKRELYSVAVGEDPAERRRREREGDTFEAVSARYLADLRARAEAGAKRGRLSGWVSAKEVWERHVPAGLRSRKVTEVNADDVRRLHKRLGDAGKAPTADHLRTVLHAVFEWARTEGLIDSNPAGVVKRYSKPPQRRRALTLAELAKLGAVLAQVEQTGTVTIHPEDGEPVTHRVAPAAAVALRILAMTGMRKSELLGHQTKARRGPREGLRWSDVDLEAGTYTLSADSGGSGGKGGAVRTLPLGEATLARLRPLHEPIEDPEVPVVPSPRDASRPFIGLDKPRRRIYRAAGIADADTHCLRHTFESIAFSLSPGLAGALTGRALTRDRALNAYLHLEAAPLREAADAVAGRIAAAMAGELGEVVPYRRQAGSR